MQLERKKTINMRNYELDKEYAWKTARENINSTVIFMVILGLFQLIGYGVPLSLFAFLMYIPAFFVILNLIAVVIDVVFKQRRIFKLKEKEND